MSRPPSRSAESADPHAGDALFSLREDIAIRAARMIAEDGLDYAGAKRRAARDILGDQRVQGEVLPDNGMIEDEVRAYQALFQADTQPQRLAALRTAALKLMGLLEEFRPHLVGAVLNGTAGTHSDIHLQLFCDSPKDVEIFLLNQGVDFDADEQESGLPRARTRKVEVLRFLWRPERAAAPEGVHLTLYGTDDLRGALGGQQRGERVDLSGLRKLIDREPDGVPTAKISFPEEA